VADRVYTMKGHEHIESVDPLEKAHQVARIYEAQQRVVRKLDEEKKILESMYITPLKDRIAEAKVIEANAKAWLVNTIKAIPDRKNIKHGLTTYGVKPGSFSVKVLDTDEAVKELKAAGEKGLPFLKTKRTWDVDKSALKYELQLEEGTLPVLEHIKLEESEITLISRRRTS
jgi:hypothetical protein